VSSTVHQVARVGEVVRRSSTTSRAVLLYVGGQLLALAVVAVLAQARGQQLLQVLSVWDGRHFIAIAEHGYLLSADEDLVRSPAFFPGLPGLMSVVSGVLHVPPLWAGLLISWGSGVVAAVGLVRLAAQLPGLGGSRGPLLVGVFALAPMSIVLSMVYTEALFCALAVWALTLLLEERWLLAGALSLAAGLVRPTGLAVAGAVVLAALVAVLQGRATWRTWLGACLAPAGFVGYVAWVGAVMGSPTAWFRVQRQGWHTEFDLGRGTVAFVGRTLRDAPALLDVVTVATMAAAVVLFVLTLLQRQPWPVLVYSGLILLQVLGTDGIMNSRVRLLIPAFPLLAPVAVLLARERRSHAAFALLAVGLLSCWYGAYALLIYRYAI
jgi:hypothetical protein